jgi:endoglucanase
MKMILSITNKNLSVLIVFFVLSAGMQVLHAQETPFSRGVNLTNWFQAGNAGEIQFSKYTKQDFENIKSLGCDVVRLPINLHFMTDGAPAGTRTITWPPSLSMRIPA